MSAHVLNALNEFQMNYHESLKLDKEVLNQKCNIMATALSYSPMGDILESHHWRILTDCLENGAFIAAVNFWWIIRDKYYQEWESLNQPMNAQEWLSRKYK